mmetsp:Transcript_23356/g.76030  ORF Transcript_23356/g.76030 Transcript_23356/m.76030 type:complete len:325 (-) Transcript_23356:402-1376(-)
MDGAARSASRGQGGKHRGSEPLALGLLLGISTVSPPRGCGDAVGTGGGGFDAAQGWPGARRSQILGGARDVPSRQGSLDDSLRHPRSHREREHAPRARALLRHCDGSRAADGRPRRGSSRAVPAGHRRGGEASRRAPGRGARVQQPRVGALPPPRAHGRVCVLRQGEGFARRVADARVEPRGQRRCGAQPRVRARPPRSPGARQRAPVAGAPNAQRNARAEPPAFRHVRSEPRPHRQAAAAQRHPAAHPAARDAHKAAEAHRARRGLESNQAASPQGARRLRGAARCIAAEATLQQDALAAAPRAHAHRRRSGGEAEQPRLRPP